MLQRYINTALINTIDLLCNGGGSGDLAQFDNVFFVLCCL